MRNLILLSLLFSSFCFAGNYVKKADLEAKFADCSYPLTVYTKNNKNRVSLPKGFRCETHSEQDRMVDDHSKPNWGTRSKIGSCEGEEDCKTKALKLECTEGRRYLYNIEYSQVWCNKILGYQKKKNGRHITEDVGKKESYLATINQLKLVAKEKSDKVKALKLKLKSGDLNLIEINELLRKMK